jgi:hypothetical protein
MRNLGEMNPKVQIEQFQFLIGGNSGLWKANFGNEKAAIAPMVKLRVLSYVSVGGIFFPLVLVSR